MEAALTDGALGKCAGRLEDPHRNLFLEVEGRTSFGAGMDLLCGQANGAPLLRLPCKHGGGRWAHAGFTKAIPLACAGVWNR